jgi:hypothetical protein
MRIPAPKSIVLRVCTFFCQFQSLENGEALGVAHRALPLDLVRRLQRLRTLTHSAQPQQVAPGLAAFST